MSGREFVLVFLVLSGCLFQLLIVVAVRAIMVATELRQICFGVSCVEWLFVPALSVGIIGFRTLIVSFIFSGKICFV